MTNAKPFSDEEWPRIYKQYLDHPVESNARRFVATIAADRKQIKVLTIENRALLGNLETLKSRIAKLEAEKKQLRDALDYYACNALEKYPGRRAREALRPQEEEPCED